MLRKDSLSINNEPNLDNLVVGDYIRLKFCDILKCNCGNLNLSQSNYFFRIEHRTEETH